MVYQVYGISFDWNVEYENFVTRQNIILPKIRGLMLYTSMHNSSSHINYKEYTLQFLFSYQNEALYTYSIGLIILQII